MSVERSVAGSVRADVTYNIAGFVFCLKDVIRKTSKPSSFNVTASGRATKDWENTDRVLRQAGSLCVIAFADKRFPWTL